MYSLITFLSFILGSIVGSFLLVVALRYNTGRTLAGRSACFSCSTTLAWYELIPVVSYLSQKGRCRSCQSAIPSETLGAEVLTGFVFMMISLRGFFAFAPEVMLTLPYLIGSLALFVLFSILLIIFFYDVKHKIIPDAFSYTFAVLSLVSSFYFDLSGGTFLFTGFALPTLWEWLGGIIVPLPFFLIWLFSKGRMIGLGDIKLMIGIGWLFGTLQGLTAVAISFWVGTLVILATVITQKVLKKKLFGTGKGGIMKQEIPFGPFLIIGTLLTIVCNISLF